VDDVDGEFARRLRKLREERGFAQDALGRRAGFSEKLVGQIERGVRGTTLRVAVKLARALGVPLDMLIGDDERPTADALVQRQPKTGETGPDYVEGPATLLRVATMLRAMPVDHIATIERLLVAWIAPNVASGGRARKRRSAD